MISDRSQSQPSEDSAPSIARWDVEIVSRRGSSTFNEDAFVCLERVYGVFDGLTCFQWPADRGVTPGRVASSYARAVFERRGHDLAAGKVSLLDVLREANSLIAAWNERHALSPSFGAATNCAAVVLTNDAVHWIQCADASILGFDPAGRERWYGVNQLHDLEHASMQAMERAIAGGATTLKELLQSSDESDRHTYEMANKPGGYGVLNGDPAFEDFMVTGTFDPDREGLVRLFLLTDGLLVPGSCGSGSYLDYEQTVQRLRVGGLDHLFDAISVLTATDIDCLRFPRFKFRDDATGIGLTSHVARPRGGSS